MSDIPADLRFAESHEWARLEADGSVTVGISDHAQEALGDVVFVELTEVGKVFAAGDQSGVVESVKAASDIYSPVAGEVIAINEELSASPELLNSDPAIRLLRGWTQGLSTALTAATERSTSALVIAVNIGSETIKRPTRSAVGNIPSLKPRSR